MASNTPTDSANRTLAENRRARAKFTIDDTFEVGIVLLGSEVKSIRAGKIELGDAWAHVSSNGTLQLLNSYVAPYAYAKAFGHEPKRVRALLAHREEIDKIEKKVKAKGYTIVPLRVYLKNGRVKIELGLAKGKDGADRREELKEREAEREARAALSNRRAKG
ncbi:MAG: SsrA-binding protein SmpB [Myxococcales bacterium]|nr:SsrA-binding protein SmpB [Myxococcales bacterium]